MPLSALQKDAYKRRNETQETLILLNKHWAPYAPIPAAVPLVHREATVLPVPLTTALRLLTNTEHWEERIPLCLKARWIQVLPGVLLKRTQSSPKHGGKMTHFTKVSETAPVKLSRSRCNFFCSNQTLLVISYPNQNNTDKNNLLTDDTFFLNCLFNALPLPLSLHWNSDWHQKAAVLHAPRHSTTTAREPSSLPLKSWNLIRMLKIALWILQTINN